MNLSLVEQHRQMSQAFRTYLKWFNANKPKTLQETQQCPEFGGKNIEIFLNKPVNTMTKPPKEANKQ